MLPWGRGAPDSSQLFLPFFFCFLSHILAGKSRRQPAIGAVIRRDEGPGCGSSRTVCSGCTCDAGSGSGCRSGLAWPRLSGLTLVDFVKLSFLCLCRRWEGRTCNR